jgi:hypothetical protein
VEEIELQLHLIGGSVLTIVVDAETLDDIIEEYERGGHATRTVKHRMWTWIFTYDKVSALGYKAMSPEAVPVSQASSRPEGRRPG